MPLHTYLAMTAAEFQKNPGISVKIGWMACHFSPYATGLSNCPTQLPADSLLIVNDRTPVCGHDPQLIAQQVQALVSQLHCSRVLLDLQRPSDPLTAKIAAAVLQTVTCPVAVSEAYGTAWACPVFLPPIPLLLAPADYLAPWNGREIWLEIDKRQSSFLLTQSGCRPLPYQPIDGAALHYDESLCCQYRMEETPEGIRFAVENDQEAFLRIAESMGVRCLIGLYQELGSMDQ